MKLVVVFILLALLAPTVRLQTESDSSEEDKQPTTIKPVIQTDSDSSEEDKHPTTIKPVIEKDILDSLVEKIRRPKRTRSTIVTSSPLKVNEGIGTRAYQVWGLKDGKRQLITLLVKNV